jgi:hypothetical protein
MSARWDRMTALGGVPPGGTGSWRDPGTPPTPFQLTRQTARTYRVPWPCCRMISAWARILYQGASNIDPDWSGPSGRTGRWYWIDRGSGPSKDGSPCRSTNPIALSSTGRWQGIPRRRDPGEATRPLARTTTSEKPCHLSERSRWGAELTSCCREQPDATGVPFDRGQPAKLTLTLADSPNNCILSAMDSTIATVRLTSMLSDTCYHLIQTPCRAHLPVNAVERNLAARHVPADAAVHWQTAAGQHLAEPGFALKRNADVIALMPAVGLPGATAPSQQSARRSPSDPPSRITINETPLRRPHPPANARCKASAPIARPVSSMPCPRRGT